MESYGYRNRICDQEKTHRIFKKHFLCLRIIPLGSGMIRWMGKKEWLHYFNSNYYIENETL